MYAVIKTGGKQYRVSQGDRLKVEKLAGGVGDKLTFEPLLIGGEGEAKIGVPAVAGAAVEAEIVDAEGKHKKVVHFRKKKEGWTKKRGHRQQYTELLITAVRA
jgi:large subunit ribosomal protein L21